MNRQQQDAGQQGQARARWMVAAAMWVTALAIGAGCAGRPALIPNKDSALRKTSAQFASDAAKRNYEAEAPRGGEAVGRAEVDYTLKEVRVANLSPEDWENVEVWVNQKYVVHLPVLPHQQKGEGYRHLNFQLLYDNEGNYFPVSLISSKMRIERVEVYRDGKMYDVPVHLAD
jgi:hypothetical protein